MFERYFGKLTMARVNRVGFEMNSILQLKSIIRGHHVYRDIWTPVKDETVLCMEDEFVDTTFIEIYGHEFKMKQSFVWKMNVKKRNHLTSTQLVPSKIMFL